MSNFGMRRGWLMLQGGTVTRLKISVIAHCIFKRLSSTDSFQAQIYWTPQETDKLDAILRKGQLHSIDNLEAEFPGRSRKSILGKAKSLINLPEYSEPRKWTPQETDKLGAILRKGRSISSVDNLEAEFPGRSRKSILSKAYNFDKPRKLRTAEWTPQENDKLDAILRKGVPIRSIDNLEVEFPKRNRAAVIARAVKLRLEKIDHPEWSAEECSVAEKARLSGTAWRIAADSLPGRTVIAASKQKWNTTRKHELPSKVGRWGSDEFTELVRLRNECKLSWTDIGEKLGRSPKSAQDKYRLYVSVHEQLPNRYYPHWTAEEDSTVKEMVEAGKSTQDISKVLARSIAGVRERRKEMGYSSFVYWTSEEDAIIAAMVKQGRGTKCLAELQVKLPHRTPSSIKTRYKFHRKGLDLTPRLHNQDSGFISWTVPELRILQEAVAKGLTVRDLNLDDFPGRSQEAILARMGVMHRAKTTGLFHREWTASEDTTLQELIKRGVAPRDIAAHIPWRDIQAIEARITYLRTSSPRPLRDRPRRWTASEEETLQTLLKQGVKHRDIAAQLGRMTGAITSKIQKTDFDQGPLPAGRAPRWTAWEDATLQTLVKQGAALRDIATQLGRTMHAVQSRLYQIRAFGLSD